MTPPVVNPSAIVISKATAPDAVSGQVTAFRYYEERLSFAVAPGGVPEHGILLLNEDGTYTYTPAQDYLGTDSFIFMATNAEGGTSTATAAITIAEEAPTVIPGTEGDDVLIGGALDNTIDGRIGSSDDGGADLIHGGAGNDMLAGGYPATLHGGDGNDQLIDGLVQYGEASDDVLRLFDYGEAYGGQGNDTLHGEIAANLYGGEGDDVFHNGGEAAYAYGGLGNDTIYTEGGYFDEEGGGFVYGDEGNDLILAADYATGLHGGDGNDTIDLTQGGSAYGDAGNDTVLGGYDAWLFGGLGDDMLTIIASGYFSDDYGGTAHGDEGNDLLIGGNAADSLAGDDGADTLDGGASADTLEGGAGNDALYGGTGLDTLEGGAGNDVLFGGAGADVLRGGAGNDRLEGGTGLDTLEGGEGNDTYIMPSIADATLEAANGGTDRVISTVSQTLRSNFENLVLTGNAAVNGTGNGLDNRIAGNAAGNVLTGNSGNDVLVGQAGADLLRGGSGNDTVAAGTGNDILIGGLGPDRLNGGAGNDVFLFTHRSEAGDAISGFRNGWGNNDAFHVSAAGFGSGLAAGGALSASRFQIRGDNLAQDADDRFILRMTDKTLWFDGNGSGSGKLTMIADLDAGAMVTSADIFLV